jgi:hypothetical protein
MSLHRATGKLLRKPQMGFLYSRARDLKITQDLFRGAAQGLLITRITPYHTTNRGTQQQSTEWGSPHIRWQCICGSHTCPTIVELHTTALFLQVQPHPSAYSTTRFLPIYITLYHPFHSLSFSKWSSKLPKHVSVMSTHLIQGQQSDTLSSKMNWDACVNQGFFDWSRELSCLCYQPFLNLNLLTMRSPSRIRLANIFFSKTQQESECWI